MGADTERLHPILGRFPPHIRRIPPLFEVGGWPRLNSKKRFFVAGAGGWSILKLTTVGAAPTVLVIFLLLSPALTLRLRSGQASWAKVWRASGAWGRGSIPQPAPSTESEGASELSYFLRKKRAWSVLEMAQSRTANWKWRDERYCPSQLCIPASIAQSRHPALHLNDGQKCALFNFVHPGNFGSTTRPILTSSLWTRGACADVSSKLFVIEANHQ